MNKGFGYLLGISQLNKYDFHKIKHSDDDESDDDEVNREFVFIIILDVSSACIVLVDVSAPRLYVQ